MRSPWLYAANTPVVNVSCRLPTLPVLKDMPLCPRSISWISPCMVFMSSVLLIREWRFPCNNFTVPQSPRSWLAGWEGMSRRLVPSLCTHPGDTPSLLPQTLLSSGTWILSRGKESWTSASLWGYRRSAMVACAPPTGYRSRDSEGTESNDSLSPAAAFSPHSPGRRVGCNYCFRLWSEHWNFSFELL